MLYVVFPVSIMGGLHAAKSKGLCATKSWFPANLPCNIKGLCAAKSMLASLSHASICNSKSELWQRPLLAAKNMTYVSKIRDLRGPHNFQLTKPLECPMRKILLYNILVFRRDQLTIWNDNTMCMKKFVKIYNV